MAKLLKLRRGTTTQHGSFTGAEGEVTIDTTKDTAVVHDGSTAGGKPLAREDMSNVSSASIAGRLGTDSIATTKIAGGALPTDVTVASANIVDGTIVNADVNASAAIAGTKISPNFGTQNISSGSITTSGALNIQSNDPSIYFTEGDANPDYQVLSNGGVFKVHDATNSADRIQIQTDGTVDILGNLDAQSGIDVTGNITASGTLTTNDDVIIDGTTNDESVIRFRDGGSESWILRQTNNDNIIAFRRNSTNYLTLQANGNVDVANGIDVTGNITATGTIGSSNISITNSEPTLNLVDNNNNSDFAVRNNDGTFGIRDTTSGDERFTINSSGTASVQGNLDVGSGVDVTGNITVTGTVDGVNIAGQNTLMRSVVDNTGVIANNVTTNTQSAGNNSTRLATTAFVTTAISNADAFPSGTKMLFQQTSAPTGWTKVTSGVDNKALRVVSGSVGSGGSNAFSNTFASRGITANAANQTQGGNISIANQTQGGNVSIANATTGGTVNNHTLTVAEMPSHNHLLDPHRGAYASYSGTGSIARSNTHNSVSLAVNVQNTGGGGSHSHGFTGGSHNHNATFSGSSHNHNATFSGSAHNHSISVTNLDLAVQYLDVIIASKD